MPIPSYKGCDIYFSFTGLLLEALSTNLLIYCHMIMVQVLHLCFVQSLTSLLTTDGSCVSSYTMCRSFVKTYTLINF